MVSLFTLPDRTLPWSNPQQQPQVTSGGTLAPAVMDPMMNDNLEDAKAVSDDELTADSDLIECQLGIKESKKFQ